METLTKKTFQVKRGLTYTYYTCAAQAGKPTLLLQHGFPDEACMWEDLIIKHLRPAGYGVIAPDMLGYAGTSKPTDPAAYKYSLMMTDLEEILDVESVDKVISLGHDWGSMNAQYFRNLKPERCSGLIMANVPYTPPSGQPFNLDFVLDLCQKVLGYGALWYWKFFAADDGAALLNTDPGYMFDIGHSPSVWRETLGTKDGVRNAIEKKNVKADLRPYATTERRNRFIERMSRDKFDAPVCWYKATVDGYQDHEGNLQNVVVNVPALFIEYKGDASRLSPPVGPDLIPNFTTVSLEGYHWGLLEDPETFGKTVTSWLEKEYDSTQS